MSEKKTIDCLCAGIIVADHVCDPIDHIPVPGELVLTAGTRITIGGCAANVSVDLVKCGANAVISGVVGSDPLGEFSARFLEEAGVDTDHLLRTSERPTSTSFIINVRGDDRRFVHCVGTNDLFSPAKISRELIASAKVLYLGGYCISSIWPVEEVVELFRDARKAGTMTVLDVVIPAPGEYWSRIAPVLRETDVFLPNDDEARVVTGVSDPFEQAARFRSAGAREVIITCGERGLVAIGEEIVQRESFPVEYLDGTGSGDAFCAGYILGMLEQKPFLERLAMGSALGASCVRAPGATAGVFDRRELEEFLKQHPVQ
ncbi:MAG TPA: carbohydrate kinase family protein [Planctomycetaceae bacterium]|nr:carbohydrate kinase family protein [Planctomycetaceae bacterium]